MKPYVWKGALTRAQEEELETQRLAMAAEQRVYDRLMAQQKQLEATRREYYARAPETTQHGTAEWWRDRATRLYGYTPETCRNSIIEPGWLPASSAIDWALRGQRIGDRKKALVPKTMARIKAGLERYHGAAVSIDSVRGSEVISPVHAEPFQTQTTSYTRSLLVPVEGREGKQAQLTGDVMRTQTTRNETGILTAPGAHLLMEYYGNGQMHPVAKAIPTISTTDRFAMVTTMRGTSPEHLASSNAPTADPFRTFAAGGNHQGITEWTVPEIEDCEFRMLEPYEITAGMAFPKTYIMTGNKREQVKQAGNAVTPPAARDLFIVAALSLTQGLELAV